MLFFFFFKQKTAYEMRISDWSSDVCSSDLDPIVGFLPHDDHHAAAFPPACSDGSPFEKSCGRCRVARKNNKGARFMNDRYNVRGNGGRGNGARGDREGVTRRRFLETASSLGRSEEHTSELQSTKRISYPFFCLKKK